jgi:hypothetical protein
MNRSRKIFLLYVLALVFAVFAWVAWARMAPRDYEYQATIAVEPYRTPVDRISSSQQMADHYVFVAATGSGPWTLQVGVGLKRGDQPVSYRDVELQVFDASGNPMVARPKIRAGKEWLEIGGPGRQACGIFTVDKSSTGDEPARAELAIYGQKAVFELKDRPEKYGPGTY